MTSTSTSTGTEHRRLGDFTWHTQAACRPTPDHPDAPADPDLWFPEPDEMDRIRAAKRICASCPVRRVCLDAALEAGDSTGIRGGLTEEERRPLHDKLAFRLDYSRVNAVLTGRDIHLTKAERHAAAHVAYRQGISEERLAWLLSVSLEYAHKLYRRSAHALQHRELSQEQAAETAERRLDRDDFGTAA